MKRTRTLVIVVTLLLVPFSRAHAETPPTLAADNTVTSVGSAATLVTLDETLVVSLATSPWETSWMSFETTGTYAGVGLQELPRPDGSKRKRLLNIRLMPPAGCTRSGVCDATDGQTNIRSIAGHDPSSHKITFEPGTYLLYAFTDPGATMTAHWHLPMSGGEQEFTTTMPVEFQTKATTVAPTVGVGILSGTHTGHLYGDGLVYGTLWETYALHGSQNGVLSLNLQWNWQCIQRADDRFDPLGMCGHLWPLRYPEDESGVSMNVLGNYLEASTGDWSHVFRLVDVAPPDGQFGAFTFWFTFASF